MKTCNAALGAILMLASTAATAGERLDDAALKQLLAGGLMTGTTSSGYSYRGEFLSDGTLRGFVRQGQWKDTGKWWVTDNKYCRQWSEWRDGKAACYSIESVGGDSYRISDDDGNGSEWTIVRL